MQNTILNAIYTIVTSVDKTLPKQKKTPNRIQSMGASFEEYIKNIFSDTSSDKTETMKLQKKQQTFSYLGNSNNPPDCILREGDAIEIKKIETLTSRIALNSSYPKAKLFSNSTMITKACKHCEIWKEKDILYIIGTVKTNTLTHISMVYGIDYASSEETYIKIQQALMAGLETIPSVTLSKTKELGRVNNVDPLGITNLRIRGMWEIQNPLKVFNYIYTRKSHSQFSLMAIINDEKFSSFSAKDIEKLYALEKISHTFTIQNVEIQTPDNPAKLKSAKLITFDILGEE